MLLLLEHSQVPIICLVMGFQSDLTPPITSTFHLDPQLQKLSKASCIIGGNNPEDEAIIVTTDFSIVKMQQLLFH